MYFFALPFQALGFTFVCLYVMLFWRKKRVDFVTLLHIILVIALFAAAFNTSDFATAIDITDRHELDKINYNDFISFIQLYTSSFLLGVWSYQWWYVGKARDKYDQNPW